MLFDVERRFLFIHVPRTAGLSICRALIGQCSHHCYLDLIVRHQRAARFLANRGRETWETFDRKFAVIRPPWDIIESDYRLTLRDAAAIEPSASHALHPLWYARVLRVKQWPSFERFVRREWLGEWSEIRPGGIWRTYCLGDGGEELGIRPILYADLPQEWPGLCDWVGVPRCELPRLNGAPGPRPDWTPELIDAVGEHCSEDIDRFGFRPPMASGRGIRATHGPNG